MCGTVSSNFVLQGHASPSGFRFLLLFGSVTSQRRPVELCHCFRNARLSMGAFVQIVPRAGDGIQRIPFAHPPEA